MLKNSYLLRSTNGRIQLPRVLQTACSFPSGQEFEELAPYIEHHHWVLMHENMQAGKPFSVVSADIWQVIKDKGLLSKMYEFFNHMKTVVQKLADSLKLSFDEIVTAFKSKQVFAFLKAVSFNLGKLLKPLKAFAQLYHDGLMKVFKEIHDSKAWQAVHSGAMKVDEFLDKYPIIKRLAGPAIAGLMIWMFLNGNFTGSPDADMDLTSVVHAALNGDWSAADLFTSPQGLLALTMLFTSLSGLSWFTPMWLDTAWPVNVLTALAYTGFKHLKSSPEIKHAFGVVKSHIPFTKSI